MTDTQTKYKVGDKLVEFGQVFRIFRIESKENSEGEKVRILHFRPFFKSSDTNGMICCIPENSIDQTLIRKPHTKKHIMEALKKLSKHPEREIETDVDSIKEILALNDPHETVVVLCSLWLQSVDSEVSFTKSKRDMFALSTNRLVEEVAFVRNISLEKTHNKIQLALHRLAKPLPVLK